MEQTAEVRQLLELAAKAAGLPPEGFEGGPMSKGGLVWSCDGECIDWNPLTDDGDAFRLARAVGMVIMKNCVRLEWRSGFAGISDHHAPKDMPPDEGIRYAILLAAAEVGRHMP